MPLGNVPAKGGHPPRGRKRNRTARGCGVREGLHGDPVVKSRKRIARQTRPRSKGGRRFKVSGVRDEAKRNWIRSKACCVSGARPGESVLWPWTRWGRQRPAVIVAAHAKARGAGGTDAELVPLERALHEEQHRIGARSFERKYAYH